MVPECGNHVFVLANRMTGLAIEIRNAASAVIQNDDRLPTSTALSAGITSSVIVTGSTLESAEAATMPNSAASIVDSTQLRPGQEVGREPEHDGTLLVLRRGPRGESEPGEAEQRPQQRRSR